MENDAVLILIKWFHLMATVAWIGGMFTNFFIYLPVLSKVLDPSTAGKLMGSVMKRFRLMVYLSIIVFLLSGILLGKAHAGSVGYFSSSGNWIFFLIIKLGLFTGMVFMSVYAFEVLAPKVAKIAAKGPSKALQRIQKNQMSLAVIGFILGMIILALSAAL